MDVGMLWFDADPGLDVPTKIQRAADYYHRKYGRVPTLCFVNPATAGDNSPGKLGPLDVKTSRSVLPDHFWLGVGDGRRSGLAGPVTSHP